MKWEKLDRADKSFGRGLVLRTPAKWPYEDRVDFMLMENNESPSGFTLVVSSGYKSGLPLSNLPKEARDDTGSISAAWLGKNWTKWIYQDSNVEDVYFANCYEIDSNWTP